MPLKTFTTSLSKFNQEIGLRFDYKFLDWKESFEKQYKDTIKLKRILDGYYKGFAFKGEDFLDSGEVFVLKGVNFNNDYSIDFSSIQYLPEDFYEDPKYKNFKTQNGDIVISLVGSIGKIAIVDENYPMLLNQNNIALRINQDLIKNKIFVYIIDSILRKIVKKLYSSAGYAFLRIEDLFALDIPKIPLPLQNSIVAEIEPIEEKIAELKSRIVPASDIINRVFAREFGFDLVKFEELKKKKIFEIDFQDIKQDQSLRCGNKTFKHHYGHLFSLLDSITTVSLGKIFGYIRNGAAPDFDTDGESKVVKIAQLRNGYIDYDSCESISDTFYLGNPQLRLNENDIFIVNRGTGSIGKVDIAQNIPEGDYVIGGSIYVLRELDDNFNHEFVTYFLRSTLGYFQMEYGFFGNTNQIALYLPTLNSIKIPDISLTEQQRIVDEIRTELDAQKVTEEAIASERMKIDVIIEKAINP